MKRASVRRPVRTRVRARIRTRKREPTPIQMQQALQVWRWLSNHDCCGQGLRIHRDTRSFKAFLETIRRRPTTLHNAARFVQDSVVLNLTYTKPFGFVDDPPIDRSVMTLVRWLRRTGHNNQMIQLLQLLLKAKVIAAPDGFELKGNLQ